MPNEEKTIEVVGSNEPYELENQFILRLPPVPAASLRAAVASGVNLRDRLSIQIEQDMRHGKVQFDGWSLPGKIVDLPTIIESHKTLDKKTFYKTADICQMMICKEEVDQEDRLDEKAEEGKKGKDGKDKKFFFPHGITPPLKNVRKKRFRKTLKKKFVDVPEIEKEVRRLFRSDIDAISVKFEVVNADEDRPDARSIPALNNNSQSMDIVENELFGDIITSSDEDDTRAGGRVSESDEASRLSSSAQFDTLREISSAQFDTLREIPERSSLVTEFQPGILGRGTLGHGTLGHHQEESDNSMAEAFNDSESTNAAAAVAALEEATGVASGEENDALLSKLAELEDEIRDIRNRRHAQEVEIEGIDNPQLRDRFLDLINSLKEQEAEKQRMHEEINSMIRNQ